MFLNQNPYGADVWDTVRSQDKRRNILTRRMNTWSDFMKAIAMSKSESESECKRESESESEIAVIPCKRGEAAGHYSELNASSQ